MSKYDDAVEARTLVDDMAAESLDFHVGVETSEGEAYPVIFVSGDSLVTADESELQPTCDLFSACADGICNLLAAEAERRAVEAAADARSEAESILGALPHPEATDA